MATFCQICRHPSNEPPGHEPGCPVLTGEPVRGSTHWSQFGINQQDMQPLNQIQQAQGQMGQAGQFVAYSDIDPRILAQFQELRNEIRALRQEVRQLGELLSRRGHTTDEL